MRRKQRLDLAGWALIATCVLCVIGMGYFAYKVDEARGISVGQSLDNWGL